MGKRRSRNGSSVVFPSYFPHPAHSFSTFTDTFLPETFRVLNSRMYPACILFRGSSCTSNLPVNLSASVCFFVFLLLCCHEYFPACLFVSSRHSGTQYRTVYSPGREKHSRLPEQNRVSRSVRPDAIPAIPRRTVPRPCGACR